MSKIIKKEKTKSELENFFSEDIDEMEEMEEIEETETAHDDIDEREDVDEVEEDDEEYEDDEEDDDDLLTLPSNKRQAKIGEGTYNATIGKPKAERTVGKYGEYIQVTIPFHIKNSKTGETVTVEFKANRSMSPLSRLYPVVREILGREPEAGFSLKNLQGKKVRVTIKHNIDSKGNVWESVESVRQLPKK